MEKTVFIAIDPQQIIDFYRPFYALSNKEIGEFILDVNDLKKSNDELQRKVAEVTEVELINELVKRN